MFTCFKCNPFNAGGHNNIRNNLNIFLLLTEKLFRLNIEHKVCDMHCKKISKLKCDASLYKQKLIGVGVMR
jgi:hypothetical protein